MDKKYDVIVIGAGHAGCEAAAAAANMGSKTLLITMDMNKIAQMSCNPAIGGIAKGQIVREIDAMGGYTGLVTDASTLQFRMLNRSKGPAMWSPRAQCDRVYFSFNWRYILENTKNLNIWQDSVSSLIIENQQVKGVCTLLGAKFTASSVVITAGTFLNGKLFIGKSQTDGGRVGEPSSYSLTEQLNSFGIASDRMKTGTPPRIDIRSVDLNRLLVQPGDELPQRFSFLNVLSPIQKYKQQLCCYMVYTNEEVHDILRSGFKDSPLFSGVIHGKGPRYCPSIEDKLKTFAGKTQHQLFLEPEGWNTNEYYLQGFSSSLPIQTQIDALKHIQGLENVEIYRPAYAVEYDYFPPTQLNHSLESKLIKGLFFAGQVNGTTGYEEAAAQGLMAGVNASRFVNGKEPLVLNRDQAYIGVLIDDLVTKGVDEPYRMFTSRAEYRILLRHDNADLRLTELSYNVGLASRHRLDVMNRKYSTVSRIREYFSETSIKPDEINDYLVSKGSSPLNQGRRLDDILQRPQISIFDFVENVPRGTQALEIIKSSEVKEDYVYLPYKPVTGKTDAGIENNICDSYKNEILESVEIGIKYDGYIERERRIADKILRLENVKIPANFDYGSLKSLSIESRQKLTKIRPQTIAQASRIPGVSPADISILLVYFGR